MNERIAAILLPILHDAVHANLPMQNNDCMVFLYHSIVGTGKSYFSSHEHAYNRHDHFLEAHKYLYTQQTVYSTCLQHNLRLQNI